MSLIRKLKKIMGLNFGSESGDEFPEGNIDLVDISRIKMLSIPRNSMIYDHMQEILQHTDAQYAKDIKIKGTPRISLYKWDMFMDSISLLKEIDKEAMDLKGGTEGRHVAVVSYDKDDHPVTLVITEGDEILAAMSIAPEVHSTREHTKNEIKKDLLHRGK